MSINIKKSHKGRFTKKAKAAGKSVQEMAAHVLAHKDEYSAATVKQANFARNATKFKHEDGGSFGFNPLSVVMDKNVSQDGSSLHVNGNYHENGGTKLDTDNDGVVNVEAEKNEKIRNQFIFSDNIGYDKNGNPTYKDKDVKTTFAEAVGREESKYRNRPSYDTIGMSTKEEAMAKIKGDNEKTLQVKEIIARNKSKGKMPKAADGQAMYQPKKGIDTWGNIGSAATGVTDNNQWGGTNENSLGTPTYTFADHEVTHPSAGMNIGSGDESAISAANNTSPKSGVSAAQISGYAGAAGNLLRGTGLTSEYQNQSGVSSGFNAIKETSKAVPFVGGFVTAGDALGDVMQTGITAANKKGNVAGAQAASYVQGLVDPIAEHQKIADLGSKGVISKGQQAGYHILNFLGGAGIANAVLESKYKKELYPDQYAKKEVPSFVNSEGVKVSKYGGYLPKAANGMSAETQYNMAKIGELGLKGVSTFQKPESQELYQDTTPFQRHQIVADNTALNTGYNTAVKTLASQSPQARAANMANLYSTMTDAKNQYNTQVQNQNVGLSQAYEQNISNQTRYNNQNRYLTDDINARNQANARNMQREFYTDAGNYANNRYEFQSQDRTNKIQYGVLNNMYKNYQLHPDYKVLINAGLTPNQAIEYLQFKAGK